MKALLIIPLILTGCGSTYTINDSLNIHFKGNNFIEDYNPLDVPGKGMEQWEYHQKNMRSITSNPGYMYPQK